MITKRIYESLTHLIPHNNLRGGNQQIIYLVGNQIANEKRVCFKINYTINNNNNLLYDVIYDIIDKDYASIKIDNFKNNVDIDTASKLSLLSLYMRFGIIQPVRQLYHHQSSSSVGSTSSV